MNIVDKWNGQGAEIIRFAPRGNSRVVFTDRSPQILLHGPAGTGKSRSLLEKVHLILSKYEKARGLMIRKTRFSMTETCMWMFENKVLHDRDGVKWHAQEQRYEYPNGSQFIVCGMDKPSKILSSEYDIAYVNESTELELDDWETITTRLRNGAVPYQQIVGDCNPSHPRHWLWTKENLVRYDSRHEDNPVLWNAALSDWTERGKQYIETLDRLTGVRYLRLRKGVWAAAEGIVYDEWDRACHMVDYFPPPDDWTRYWAIDFGYTHPFVWQAWAEDHDGNLYRYREIYHTQRLVEDHCEQIKTLIDGDRPPSAIVCDHDAEDRATFERHLNIPTLPAFKLIRPGIQGVKNRLRKAGNGKPRIFFMRDSLVEMDQNLRAQSSPTCTEEEFESYIWDQRPNLDKNLKSDELPVDKYNHGMDASRYIVAFVDSIADDPSEAEMVVTIPEEDRVRISPY